jgi:hypothetical protein
MKKLPVGLSDFKTVIEESYYYVDKSLLLPRPRRFGKTLNLSMLRYFFEKPALAMTLGGPGANAVNLAQCCRIRRSPGPLWAAVKAGNFGVATVPHKGAGLLS